MFLLNNGPKANSNDSVNLDKLKRYHKVLPLTEKIKVINLEGTKDCMPKVAKICRSSAHEIVEKKKDIGANTVCANICANIYCHSA